ncbi:MAG: hypothetical protein F6K38_05180 [Moorea sp. SIO3B2]|nr:hypothetical protein [Moorena sp. SIO3B2]NEP67046.1 hypothetical protein [Moorena sp. SIO3A5]NEQ10826.1 hypothetical protein [Moorena sp. SIO4E2]NER88861.1 hypothetical protein [Moorena sp. SIO3A2]NES44855.1 hypothetical protein [Moorena sp. SIO2C4]
MTTYNFGDIILVPFPFTDQTTIKKRPTVIISSNTYSNSTTCEVQISEVRPVANLIRLRKAHLSF